MIFGKNIYSWLAGVYARIGQIDTAQLGISNSLQSSEFFQKIYQNLISPPTRLISLTPVQSDK